MNENPRAFILMPFDTEFQSIYEDLIRPALSDAGYEVSRADSFLDQQNILRDIVRGIANADLIVADLTTLNPNVFYELGLCHGLKVPTILISQSIDEVPFDLRSYRIIIYSTHFKEAHKIKDDIQKIAKSHHDGRITFGSPIIDFLPTIIKEDKFKENLSEEPVQDIEKGIFDFIKEGNESVEEQNNIISEIGTEAKISSDNVMSLAKMIAELSLKPGPGTASKVHNHTTIIARELNKFSEKIEEDIPSLDRNINLLIESHAGYLTWLKKIPVGEGANISQFQNNIANLLNEAKEFLNSLEFYRNSVIKLMGFSKDINRSVKRLTQVVDGIKSKIEMIEAFCVKTLSMINESI